MAILALRRVLLVVNPGSRRGARLRPVAEAAFRARGVACTTAVTTAAGDAKRLTTDLAPGHDAIFTLGGDGTVMEVVDAAIPLGIPIGVLRGGTGNLVAGAIGIPRSVRRAIDVLREGDIRTIDIARLSDGRAVAFGAGVGIDAFMIETTSRAVKARWGVLAYVRTAMIGSLRIDSFDARTTVDGVERRYRAAMIMVVNFGAVLGGLIHMAPNSAPDDGRLDLCVYMPKTRWDAVRLAWRILRKDFRSDPCFEFAMGRHIRIETDPPRMAQADGELLGAVAIDATIEPRVARLLVPRGRA